MKLLVISLSFLISSCYGGSIQQSLKEKIAAQGTNDAVLELPSVMNSVLSNPMLKMLSGPLKVDMMTSLMQQLTSQSQSPFVNALKGMGVKDVTPFWISNKVSLGSLNMGQLDAISKLSGPFNLREAYEVRNIPPKKVDQNITIKAEVQWGVKKIGASNVWRKTTGKGIVVANIDSGVNYRHEALKNNYAGKWLDAVNRRSRPYDDQGHGTHTMGTICGQTRGIGVAPGATWIACKALDSNNRGSEGSLRRCAQWILQQKPDVVSNSWGGGQGADWFNDEIRAWTEAGIIPVFSLGNSGPDCGSANSPADQDNVFSVGSTTIDDLMSDFSSRGPSVQGLMKPEISAPGEDVVSAGHSNTNAYVSMSGTSMACPHVAGAVALMLSANGGRGSVSLDQVRSSFEESADHPSVSNNDLSCGTAGDGEYPNNVWGYGRLNIQTVLG